MKKRKLIRIQDIIIGSATVFSLLMLLNAGGAFADSSVVDVVTVTVPASCSLTSTVNTAHTTAMNVGAYQSDIGETTFKVLCNDANGFSVYAIGYSDETYGNTTMVPSNLPVSNAIATGTATSGDNSNWAMKLTAVSGDYTPTLATGFNAYHEVPSNYTKVATFPANTDAVSGSSFKSTYAAYISQSQPADTYTGKVKYTILHPSSYIAPDVVGTIQNLASSNCTTTPTRAVDNRDGQVYIIQRLLDGNCWMMENLDLVRTDLTTDLTSANTNIATTVTAATFNSWRKTSGTNTSSAGEFIPLTTSNTSNGLDTDEFSGTPYGTLYNYYAASAGTKSGSTNSSNAEYDICPAGWRLPTAYYYGEFWMLYNQYPSGTLMRTPISNNGAAFAMAGRFTDGTPTSQGATTSRYWSSTRSSDTNIWILHLTASSQGVPSNNTGASRGNGYPIRCILNDLTISKLTYLQNFRSITTRGKTSIINSMEENTTYNLIDGRDNRSYAIAKLKDGKIWMTENLDLGKTDLTTNLVSGNTNLNSYITYDTFNSWRKTSNTGTYTDGEFVNVSGTDSNSGTPYGTLYNYYVASAGTISGSSNSSNAEYDICPAGWRLPTGGSSGELSTLYGYYSSFQTFRSPITSGGAAFSLAGSYEGGQPGLLQGNSGAYWSSTVYNDTKMSSPLLDYSAGFLPDASFSRNYGISIRCVVK